MSTNDSIACRILNCTDREQILHVAQSHNTLMGVPFSQEEFIKFTDILDHSYLNPQQPKRLLLGAFEDQQLLCFLGMAIWSEMPYWTFCHLRSLPTMLAKRRGIPAAMNLMFDLADQQGLTTYFLAINRHRQKAFRQLFNRYVPAIKNYIEFEEAVVPKYTQPKYKYQKFILGEKIWPIDVLIGGGKRSLNDERLNYA